MSFNFSIRYAMLTTNVATMFFLNHSKKKRLFIYLREREREPKPRERGRGREGGRFPAEKGPNAGLSPRTLRS